MSDSHIGLEAPKDGRKWDYQCARCGSSLIWERCCVCGGEGVEDVEDDENFWYESGTCVPCSQCNGQASFPCCLSSIEFCEMNPLAGREHIKRDTVEWFTLEKLPKQNPK